MNKATSFCAIENNVVPYNTSGMYRGRVGNDGKVTVEIYTDGG